jgi:glycosyltransferase involved in cell wall biosynthesis
MCLVSVIIPYYNRQATILRALNSVATQSYRNYEIILINDGSEDHSSEIVEKFILDNPQLKIITIEQRNQGPSIARNKGIEKAKGEYIAFLDSDDEWLPEKLERQIMKMKEFSIDMLGCNYYLINNDIQTEFAFTNEMIKHISFKSSLFKHYFATPCIVVKKKVIMDVGLFPEKQNYMEDAFVFTNIARKYNTCLSGDFLVNIYKLPYGESGLSSQLKEMEKNELSNFKRFRVENNKYENKLSLIFYTMAIVFSWIKYIKRILIVKLRHK